MSDPVTHDDGSDLAGPRDLLEMLGSIARRLSEADTLTETLQRVVDLVGELIDRCDGVSLMLVGKGGKVATPAYSSEVARDSDLAQYETGEGPCLAAIREEHTIMIADMAGDDRWPAYRERALELGVRSMMSFQLFVSADSFGALDLYSRQPKAFDEQQRSIGQVFAAHASVAVKAALTEAGLETALRSRDVIGQAKGIIMARRHLTEDMAFDVLLRHSQAHNIPVRDVAARIARTGQLPEQRV